MMVEEVAQRDEFPCPVALQRVVCYSNYGLYVMGGGAAVGGSRSASHYAPQMCKFNLSTGKWTKMAPAVPSITDEQAAFLNIKKPDIGPIVLASRCTAFMDRNRLLIAGGRLLNRSFDVPSFSTYVYNVESQTTTAVARPAPQSDASLRPPTGYADVFDQCLLKWNENYILCSRVMDEQTGKKRFLFHLLVHTDGDDNTGASVVWRDLSPTDSGSSEQPSCGDLCAMAIYDDCIYCIDKSDEDNCLDVQWRYDLCCRRWQRVQSVPANELSSSRHGRPADRMFPCCVPYGDCVYVVAGSSMAWAGPKSNPVFSDIWRLHLPTLRWSLMPARLPDGLWFHSADVSPNGCMYVFGGFTDMAGRKASRKLWRIHLEPPSLSSLCWNTALRASNFKMKENSDEDLRDLRVPLCFVWALRW